MPILNRALTRSAPRSAMRLASSCTVIASGTTTSRTCLVAGPVSMWWRFSFSRARRSAASERARLSSSSERARVTVSLPRWRCSSAAAARARRLGALGRGRMAGTAEAALRLPPRGGCGDFAARPALRRRAAASSSARRRASSAAASSALRFSSARRRSSSVCSTLARSSRRRASSSEARRGFFGLAQKLLPAAPCGARSRPAAKACAAAEPRAPASGAGAGARRRAWALRPAGLRPGGRGCAAS